MSVHHLLRIRVYAVIAALLAAVLFIFVHAPKVDAVETANTLKVTPVRTDIEVKPGKNKVVKVTVTNLTDDTIAVSAIQNDFIAGDERGTPALILDEKKYAPTHSLKRFMTPIEDFTIPGNQSKTINVMIKVPSNAQAGGYFGALRFAPTVPDDGGQVNLSPSVASLILLTVPGDLVEKLTVTDFDIQQDGKTGAIFGSPENIQASLRFANEGNVQSGPVGKVSVKSGGKVIYETDFNNKDPRDMTLPDSARRWDIPLEKISGFGQYTVLATFTYGTKNQTIEIEKSFWVIPLFVIIIAVILFILLLLLIAGIWFFLRGYKKRILRSQSGHRGYRR